MARTPPAELAAHVRRADRAFAQVVRRAGPPPASRATPVPQRFGALATAILHQQLAGAAAAAIHSRVLAVTGDPITAAGLTRAGDDALAACGVSGPKRRSLWDLVERTSDGTIDFAALGRRSDEDVEAALTQVRGVGPWTAHMFCLFTLGRQDVWPVGDYGVRAGWSLLHGDDELVAPKALEALGEPFRPYRSAAAWYCWRAVELARNAPQPR
jgi:3-methyladenine DNA glycosylase/8-oxoguanine DNA glycosylase